MNPSRLSPPAPPHRFIGVAVTALAHVALIVAWQAARQVPLPERGAPAPVIELQLLPERLPAARASGKTLGKTADAARHPSARPVIRGHTGAVRPDAPAGRSVEPAVTALPAATVGAPEPSATATVPPERVRQILERARRDAGAADRALRKQNNPYIVAPPDSPLIRMRSKIAQAAALAPNRLWEAPKVEELVNDSGDGARRTRVITGLGVYCITERAPTTSIDMIEKHGKLRITNCGQGHEQPVNPQEWRTARD